MMRVGRAIIPTTKSTTGFCEEPVAQAPSRPKKEETPMEVDEDYNEVISDPAFLQSVLENLPGVDPQSETIRDAVGSLNKDKDKKSGDKEKDKQ
uniref:Uncharacterized protein n=1 Tax=Phlebotomus papatasi TaxID=29031 RepID=A0A1B0DBJ6_PHLPP